MKNFGMFLDDNLNKSSCVSNLCKNVYLRIRNISQIRYFITEDVTKKLVTSFILSKLDYWGAFPYISAAIFPLVFTLPHFSLTYILSKAFIMF